MGETSPRFSVVAVVLAVTAIGCSLGRPSHAAGAGASISSTLKQGASKVADALTPSIPVKPADDPVSLATKANPSPELYTAMARLSEQSGRVGDAERHYQQALRMDPRHVEALVGYARLKDRRGEMGEATRLYQEAANVRPDEPSIFNDLGVCLARRKMFDPSLAALERAIQLRPQKWLYRNNIAMVLVEKGHAEAALSHLKAVQSEAVACYNVAYVLQKKGDREAARRFFAQALRANPSLAEARIWLRRLEEGPGWATGSPPRVATDPRPGLGFPVPSGQAGSPTLRPQARQFPGAPGQPSLAAPAPDELLPGPGPSEPAPLPPPTLIGQPLPSGPAAPTDAPAIQPLPPVEGQSGGP